MNCLIVDDEEFSRLIVKGFVERTESLTLLAECENAKDAFEILMKGEVDIVFLDIEMPGMSGMDLVKSLPNLPQVILITGRTDVGADAFSYSLTDYLVKPIDFDRFSKAVEKAQSNLAKPIIESPSDDDIYIKENNKIVRIKLSDIVFIEALSDYVMINTAEKRHVVHYTMKGLEKNLPESEFVRVHRSYIVNISKVDTIEDMTIILPQKAIPIGASYKNKFLERLNFL